MAISKLLEVVPPTTSPSDADDKNWAAAEQWIGFDLPDDYRDFATHYGSGTFCDGFLWILNPLSTKRFQDDVTYRAEVRRQQQGSRRSLYKLFPDRPCLLTWGGDENGNRLNWLTEGEANDWPVVVESHEGDFEQFDMSMTTFLAKALMNEIRPKHVWYQPFTEDERVFFSSP